MPPRSDTGHDATIVLVRHGETEGQSSIRYYGRTDVALSDLGRAQMAAVRDALRNHHGHLEFARVFASPLRRAAEGAQLIASNSAIVTIDEFIEVDFGLFEGLTADEIRERYPDEFARWSRERLDPKFTYPGGESRAAFAGRVERGLARMLDLWERDGGPPGGTALVVAHRGVIRAIARRLANVEPAIDLASITILHREGDWRPHLLDAIDHLTNVTAA